MIKRQALEAMLQSRRGARWGVWAIAPLLCLLLPGPGVILAMFWVLAVMLLARQPWQWLGWRRPARWPGFLVVAVGAAVLLQLLATHAIEPLAQALTGTLPDVSAFDPGAGGWALFAARLLLSWGVGAVIEENVFRGFIIGYGMRVFGDHAGWLLALVGAIVFGVSHLYQGTAGVVSSGLIGLLLGALYLLSRRSLPLVMVVHGLVDTIGFAQLYWARP